MMSVTHRTNSPPVYDSVVLQDLHCVHCGYTLRQMKTYQRCRSCNTSIKKSLHLGLLLLGDPPTMAVLRVVLILMGLAAVLAWVPIGEIKKEHLYFTCQPLLAVVYEAVSGKALRDQFPHWQYWLMPLEPLVLLVAGWLLTRPNFPLTTSSRIARNSKLVRVVLFLPLIGLGMVAGGEATRSTGLRDGGAILTATLLGAVWIVWNRIRDLAFLVHKPNLYARLGLVRWLMLGTTALSSLSIMGLLLRYFSRVFADENDGQGYLFAWHLPVVPANTAFLDQVIQYALSWPIGLLCLWTLPVLAWFWQAVTEVVREAHESPQDVQPNQSI